MSVIQAIDSNYASLVAQAGLTLVMYDYPKVRYGNDRNLRSAFRHMATLHSDVQVVLVNMTQLGGIVRKTPYCPTFRMFCFLSLSNPGDKEGDPLSARQWLEAVNWAFSSAYSLKQMAEQVDQYRSNAHTDPSGWITDMIDTLGQPYGHLKALRKMLEQAEKWGAEQA